VRLGFISLPHLSARPGVAVRRTNRRFSQYEECQSEMDAIGKCAHCKVPSMLMGLFAH
jgi:hypothetical protein